MGSWFSQIAQQLMNRQKAKSLLGTDSTRLPSFAPAPMEFDEERDIRGGIEGEPDVPFMPMSGIVRDPNAPPDRREVERGGSTGTLKHMGKGALMAIADAARHGGNLAQLLGAAAGGAATGGISPQAVENYAYENYTLPRWEREQGARDQYETQQQNRRLRDASLADRAADNKRLQAEAEARAEDRQLQRELDISKAGGVPVNPQVDRMMESTFGPGRQTNQRVSVGEQQYVLPTAEERMQREIETARAKQREGNVQTFTDASGKQWERDKNTGQWITSTMTGGTQLQGRVPGSMSQGERARLDISLKRLDMESKRLQLALEKGGGDQKRADDVETARAELQGFIDGAKALDRKAETETDEGARRAYRDQAETAWLEAARRAEAVARKFPELEAREGEGNYPYVKYKGSPPSGNGQTSPSSSPQSKTGGGQRKAPHDVGEIVTLRSGKRVRITKVYPGGGFDYEEVEPEP